MNKGKHESDVSFMKATDLVSIISKRMMFRNQGLETRCAHHGWTAIASRPSQKTELENRYICILTDTHRDIIFLYLSLCVCACVCGLVYIFVFS